MKGVKLTCLLMGNREIMFNGRSLGFFSEDEIRAFTEDLEENIEV
jgi:hypothetical protein